MTFHRIHPVRVLAGELRYVLSTGLIAAVFYWLFQVNFSNWTMFGVPALGLLLQRFNRIYDIPICGYAFPSALKNGSSVLPIHQLHHSADPAFQGC